LKSIAFKDDVLIILFTISIVAAKANILNVTDNVNKWITNIVKFS